MPVRAMTCARITLVPVNSQQRPLLFLVADAGAFHLVAEPRVGRSRLFAVGRKLFDGVGIYGIPDGFVGIVVRVALFQGLQDFGG